MPDFAEATAASPTGPLVGYNHSEVARVNECKIGDLHQADYPVLFWFKPLAAETERVFDLGGNIGLAYYAYRRYLAFRASMTWTVSEVSATADAGREIAADRNETQLRFTADPADASGCDVYFSAGTLQYIEESFADMIARLPEAPRHILIQRVPLWRGERFVTLQNNGAWTVPYKVENEDAFIQSLEAIGYRLIDHWRISRTLDVINSPKHLVENYQGMYLRLEPDGRKA